jgi:hypothetical protein
VNDETSIPVPCTPRDFRYAKKSISKPMFQTGTLDGDLRALCGFFFHCAAQELIHVDGSRETSEMCKACAFVLIGILKAHGAVRVTYPADNQFVIEAP